MRTLRRVQEVRTALREARRQQRTVGLVPTMGALHEGHLSLVRRAREENDEVVVSLFVNPTQFNQPTDLDSYPRNEAQDAVLAAEAGADLLFAPSVEEIYPPGFATTVSVSGPSEPLEGVHRGRAHFDAVATVVAKLLNIVGPDTAYFGQKDAQQAAVIRRLVRDLEIPVRIEICPTVREPDGLALSSRNRHLSPEDRRVAPALHEALESVRAAVLAGEREASTALAPARAQLRAAGVRLDYLELAAPDSLQPVQHVSGEVLALVAGHIGQTRLIDNVTINLPAGSSAHGFSNGRR